MNSHQKPQITDARSIAKSRLFNIEEVDLTFSNGAKRTFERCGGALLGRGSVLIVPFIDRKNILLIREYAVGFDRYELSFPKGLIDEGETREEAANRELKEEAGFGAHQIDFLKTAATSPNYMRGQMQLMIAQDLYSERLPGDEPEPLEVISWPIADYKSLVAREDFSAAMNISALYLAMQFLCLTF
jgi:ADP-ribose diphosphatase